MWVVTFRLNQEKMDKLEIMSSKIWLNKSELIKKWVDLLINRFEVYEYEKWLDSIVLDDQFMHDMDSLAQYWLDDFNNLLEKND